WPEDAVPPPRRGKCTFQGTWPQWHFHHNDCQRSRCLSESSHLLLPHQGSVVCRGRVSRHAPYCRARRKGGGTCTHAEGLHGSGGRQHLGGRRTRAVPGGTDPRPPAARPDARNCTHDRPTPCRGRTRSCWPGDASWVARASTERRACPQVLDDRARRRARGLCRGPEGGGDAQG